MHIKLLSPVVDVLGDIVPAFEGTPGDVVAKAGLVSAS